MRICATLVMGYQEAVDEEAFAGISALRVEVEKAMLGCELARARTAEALTKVMIPEALDYPI